jgi:hypothetical protein
MSDFVGDLIDGVRTAFEPLEYAFSNEVALQRFFAELGWDINVASPAMGPIRAGFALGPALSAAATAAQELQKPNADAEKLIPPLKNAVVGLLQAVKALATTPPGGLPAPFDQNAFWNEVPLALANVLLARFLEVESPPVYGTLRLLGIIEFTRETPAGPNRLPYIKVAFRWDRFPKLITNPVEVIQETYRWNVAGQSLDHEKLGLALLDFFRGLRFPARQQSLGNALLDRFYTQTNPALGDVRETAVPFLLIAGADWSSYLELGLVIAPIPPKAAPDQPPIGIVLTPLAHGSITSGMGVAGTPLAVRVKGGFDAEGIAGAEIRPAGVHFFVAPGNLSIEAGVALVGSPTPPWIPIGNPGGFRIEITGVEVGVGLRGLISAPEFTFRAGTGQGTIALVIQMGSADGFLGKILGGAPIRIEFGGNVLWSSKTGFHFEGGGGLEFAIPLHLDLTIIQIDLLTVSIRGAQEGIAFDAGINAKALLGPLTAVVENVGLRTTLHFAGTDGGLGPITVGLGFKPPNGVGLAIDAGAVKGGGYLYFDFDKEEYAGALELVFSGFLTLTAIGLVTTRLPDGSKGFSLLIIITAEFGTGIQLGFGFTLIGVGGLLGLNRTVRLQPLADGVRTGAVANILFPKDVVKNAPRIISDLKAIFPPFEGKFLIGPMAKIGWGSPPLITLSLGIIIEIPGNLAILGVLKCILPDAKAPVLVLQVAFVGAIEFDKKRVWLFAGIFDSKVLTFTLEGEMGVLAAFGDDADFVLSVGGFHPRFKPPPLPFPTPKRLAITILDESQARIRVSCYFAVTTNTVQFGARAELYFGFSSLSVTGDIRFDALFQFSPFYFIIELGASVSLKIFGMGIFSIRLEMSLEGPTPWHARGRGSISFFFFDVSASFDETWGQEKDTTLPPVAVFPVLEAELDKASNWNALPPRSGNLLVSLRVVDEKKEFVLHPVGTLRVSQRAIPLNSTIDLVGAQKPSDANRFAVTVQTAGLAVAKSVKEQFAPAQFHAMSKNEKLAKPAFSPEDGGVDVTSSGEQLRSSLVVRRVVRYEQSIVDTNFKRFVRRFVVDTGSLFRHFLAGNAAAQSALSARTKRRMQPFDDAIETVSEGFGVATKSNNKMAPGTQVFGSEAGAREHMNNAIALDPALAGTLHIVPEFELNRAA